MNGLANVKCSSNFNNNLGRLIQKIKDETGVSMVINQRVSGMILRSTHATGTPKDLARACSIMYNTLEE